MAEEYLTPNKAETVELPIINPFARLRKISRLAGQLAMGREELKGMKPKTRTGLVLLAYRRSALDFADFGRLMQTEALKIQEAATQRIQEISDELNLNGVSNDPNQLQLEEIVPQMEQPN